MKTTKTTTSLLTIASLAALLGTAACSGSSSSGTTGSASGSSTSMASGSAGDISAGVSADADAQKLLPASMKSGGTLTVAMDLAYPPTSFLSPTNEPMGYNVDIARLLAAKLGLKLKIANVSFDTIVPGLTGGRYDFTATDMSATPERLKVLDMINYWTDGSSLGVKAGNPDKLNLADKSICGKTIAVMTGTTQAETYLPAISKDCTAGGKEAVKQVTLPNVQTALTQLASSRIAGIFYDTPSLAWAAKQNPSAFQLTTPQYDKPASLGTDLVAIGLKKGSELSKPMQMAMQSIIDSPLYLKALNNWGLGSGAIKTATMAS